MSKCKYTYMYFPLYKQVVLSEETVFGEGDTDPQALHHGIHLLRSLSRTRKITYCFYLFSVRYNNAYLIQNTTLSNQAQASEQFLASIKLASNKAVCLKTPKMNKSKMYF